jgi:hypothetical protein
MKLTCDQARLLADLSRGYGCFIQQDNLATLAWLGLAEVYDRCWLSQRLKYRITDAGLEEAKRREASRAA